MSYINIEWMESRPEHQIIQYLIESVGYFAIDNYRDIRVKREDLIKYQKRVNDFIEKFLKTDLRVKIPLIDNDDDIAWCEARVHRKIDFNLI